MTELEIHFISGLPRAGSTLLAGILRQNPKFHTAMSGPLAEIFDSALRVMSFSEGALFISDQQRQNVLRCIVEGYYCTLSSGKIILDTNRTWTRLLPAVVALFPTARLFCCVRNPAWILDSIERLVQRNALLASKMFAKSDGGDVYARTEGLMKSGFVGSSISALRQAWFGELADHLIAIRYESLTSRPRDVINKIYDLLDERRFPHDFEHVEYDEPEFDARLNMPGLHRVSKRVERRERQTILPPDIFQQNNREFWDIEEQNPRNVRIL